MTKLNVKTPTGKEDKDVSAQGCIMIIVSMASIGYGIYVLCTL